MRHYLSITNARCSSTCLGQIENTLQFTGQTGKSRMFVVIPRYQLVYLSCISRNVPVYFKERSLYSLFRNVIPEIIFGFSREIGVFDKI